MTVTWCDVCGKEMPKKEYAFDIIISSYGRTWDICDDCCAEFNKWCSERSRQYRKSEKENKTWQKANG